MKMPLQGHLLRTESLHPLTGASPHWLLSSDGGTWAGTILGQVPPDKGKWLEKSQRDGTLGGGVTQGNYLGPKQPAENVLCRWKNDNSPILH